MDLSGRTPIYRLSQVEQSWPQVPTPTPSNYVSPYRPPQHQQDQQQQGLPPQQSPDSAQLQNDNAAGEGSPGESPPPDGEGAVDTPSSQKRRGRKLLEEQVAVLFNCCLEQQGLYADQDRVRFWITVASKLKQRTRRSFAWQSCRRIVTDRSLERRVHRREIEVGRRTEEQAPSELTMAIDRWIAMEDMMEQQISAALTAKRSWGQTQPAGPGEPAAVAAAPVIATPGSGPGPAKRVKQSPLKATLAESLVKLSESLTQEAESDSMKEEMVTEVRDVRRGMDDMRQSMEETRKELNALRVDMNRKFELVIQLLTEMKEQEESG
ncbi:hypothetical protein MW887_000985 [Aspergillus wentii]|nr:hypothetical protein MW887_000985 [Aspergillus wentii]